MITRRHTLAILTVALSTGWASAQEVDTASIEKLTARVAKYEATLRAWDMVGILDFLPPSLLKQIAAQADMETPAFRQATRELMQDVMKDMDLSLVQFSMGLEDAKFAVSSANRAYAIMHSTTDFPGLGEKVTPIVALIDENIWYLVRIDDPMAERFLTEIYPDLVNLDLTR